MARRGENIYKRKDGRYEGRYIKGYNIEGKAIYGYVYDRGYTREKEKLVFLKTDKRKYSKNSSMKLSEWMDIWFNSETEIKKTTKIIYRGHIENHINPMLGEKS